MYPDFYFYFLSQNFFDFFKKEVKLVEFTIGKNKLNLFYTFCQKIAKFRQEQKNTVTYVSVPDNVHLVLYDW
jgi:hypothetical protein